MEHSNKIPGLTLEAESLVAHLQILGYWPVQVRLNFGNRIGIRNETQVVHVRYNRVNVDKIESHWVFTELEWWKLTDDSIRRMAYFVDNTLAGW